MLHALAAAARNTKNVAVTLLLKIWMITTIYRTEVNTFASKYWPITQVWQRSREFETARGLQAFKDGQHQEERHDLGRKR